MQRQAGPSSTHLEMLANATEFASDDEETRAIAFLPEGKTLEAYKQAGNKLRVFMSLGHCSSEEVASSMGFKMGTVAVFHPRQVLVSIPHN